jgi:hypothetical protein
MTDEKADSNANPASSPAPAPGGSLFPWACLVVATVALGYLCWAVEDLRQEAKTSGKALNAHLPQILEKVEGSSATLKEVSDDLKKLRDLSGASGPRDKSLALFADRLLDRLQEARLEVGLSKMIGAGLKDAVPAAAWVRDARKEALWLTFRAKSKQELFDRLCQNKFGSDWLVLPPGDEAKDQKPRPLAEWFAEHDGEAKALLPVKED